MPSKLLTAAADAGYAARNTKRFGIRTTSVEVDGRAVMQRVRHERDRFVGAVLESVERIPESSRLGGHARFVDDHTLMVDEHTRVQAGRVVIATGSRPTIVPVLESAGDRPAAQR